jgi:hypothetical protein
MTRRYLLDTGPAQDFLFQRRGVQDRVEAARRAGAKSGPTWNHRDAEAS